MNVLREDSQSLNAVGTRLSAFLDAASQPFKGWRDKSVELLLIIMTQLSARVPVQN